MNFKPGDRVRCKKTDKLFCHFRDRVYVVIKTEHNFVGFEGESIAGWFFDRFECVTPPTPFELDLIAYIASEKRALGLL